MTERSPDSGRCAHRQPARSSRKTAHSVAVQTEPPAARRLELIRPRSPILLRPRRWFRTSFPVPLLLCVQRQLLLPAPQAVPPQLLPRLPLRLRPPRNSPSPQRQFLDPQCQSLLRSLVLLLRSPQPSSDEPRLARTLTSLSRPHSICLLHSAREHRRLRRAQLRSPLFLPLLRLSLPSVLI